MYWTYFAIYILSAKYNRLNEQTFIPEIIINALYLFFLYKRSFRISPDTYNTLQATKFTPLKCEFVKFCICAEFLDTKLSENSNFDTPVGVPTKARVVSMICNFGNYGFTFRVFKYFGYNCNVFEDFWGEKKKKT